MQTRGSTSTSSPDEDLAVNLVRLVGRVSAEPEQRELPSGDQLVQLRVIVPRPATSRGRSPGSGRGTGGTTAGTGSSRVQVDTIDVTCWSALTRRRASRLQRGQVVEVHGALRRRFFRAGPVTQSRYEVEASLVRRVGGMAPSVR